MLCNKIESWLSRLAKSKPEPSGTQTSGYGENMSYPGETTGIGEMFINPAPKKKRKYKTQRVENVYQENYTPGNTRQSK
ncbi:hypothetical protein LCGC14_0661720 [marine sediment metagenome]|uniref:Uncharacterized protein n=1 Tax=marine sediment metagenome TaxID=412755 RepID=A0A0F9RDH5_9ZZZZ